MPLEADNGAEAPEHERDEDHCAEADEADSTTEEAEQQRAADDDDEEEEHDEKGCDNHGLKQSWDVVLDVELAMVDGVSLKEPFPSFLAPRTFSCHFPQQ